MDVLQEVKMDHDAGLDLRSPAQLAAYVREQVMLGLANERAKENGKQESFDERRALAQKELAKLTSAELKKHAGNICLEPGEEPGGRQACTSNNLQMQILPQVRRR